MQNPVDVDEERRGSSANQEFLDTNQYSIKSILKYERIFGHTWVSTGGVETTKKFCTLLKLQPNYKILDIGCGTGGSAFYMARNYGVTVHAIDLSKNMISIAENRLKSEENLVKSRVKFEMANIFDVDFHENEFDVIYSRDTILHIRDKEMLFAKILSWLKPGGQLLITDYCKGDRELSTEFHDYVENRGYDLRTVKEYGDMLKKADLKTVEAKDNSATFLDILQNELNSFIPTKDAFIKDFSQEDFDDIADGWAAKIRRVRAGDHVWGLFTATK